MKFLEALAQQFAGKPIEWDELEHALIRADLGVALTTRIIAKLQEREAWSLLGIQDVIKVAREEIAKILAAKAKPLQPISGKPNVILVAGVNGTGKTTSVAKLAHYLKKIEIPCCSPPQIRSGRQPLNSLEFGQIASALKW